MHAFDVLLVLLTAILGGVAAVLSFQYDARRIALISGLAALCMTLVAITNHADRQSLQLAPLFAGAAAWSFTDLTTGYIRERLTMVLLPTLLIVSAFTFGLENAVVGLIACVILPACFLLVAGFDRHGGGDVWAAACIGAGLGFLPGIYAMALAVWIAGVATAVHIVFLLVKNRAPLRTWKGLAMLPTLGGLGPYYCAGAVGISAFPQLASLMVAGSSFLMSPVRHALHLA